MGKKRWKGTLHALGLIILVTLTFGCTLSGEKGIDNPPSGGAVLSVTPTILKFEIKDPGDQDSYADSFDVKNIGDGKLVWYVKERSDFANCDPELGSITSETDTVTVRLSNKTFEPNGMICIDSNGGEGYISVIVDVYVLVCGTVTVYVENPPYPPDPPVPVEGALVYLGDPSSVPAVTNSEGYYELWAHEEDILDKNGNLVVKALKDGYKIYDWTGKCPRSTKPPNYTHDFEMTPEEK